MSTISATAPAASEGKLPWDDYVEIRRNGDKPLLLILNSGLAVSAFSFAGLVDELARRFSISIRAWSLAGHSGNDRDFRMCRADDWITQARTRFLDVWNSLDRPRVIFGGFSAGSLVSQEIACWFQHQFPGYLDGVLSIAHASTFGKSGQRRMLKKMALLDRCRPLRPVLNLLQVKGSSSCADDLSTDEYLRQPRFEFYPLMALAGLVRLQETATDNLCELRCPLAFFHGSRDERVPVDSIRELCRIVAERTGRAPHFCEIGDAPHTLCLAPIDARAAFFVRASNWIREVWNHHL